LICSDYDWKKTIDEDVNEEKDLVRDRVRVVGAHL
jgi:hypothetical protein